MKDVLEDWATNIQGTIGRLRKVSRPPQRVATLTFDLSGPGALPGETLVFIKDLALESLVPGSSRPSSRASLRELTERIQSFLLSDFPPGTRGLFLCAGPELWEPLPLNVRLPNFLHLGNVPYLPPLLAALQRAPRSYVVRCHGREAELEELDHGLWRGLDRWELPGRAADSQRLPAGRAPAAPKGSHRGLNGTAGSIRDRLDQHLDSEAARLLKSVVRRILTLPPAPAEVRLLYFGDAGQFGEFRKQLPGTLKDRADFLGVPPSTPAVLRQRVETELARQAERRLQEDILEYEDRLDQRYLIARGPGEVLESRARGRLARLFLDAEDPVWGVRCLSCTSLQEGTGGTCATCGGRTTPASLTQEMASHALAHPPLPLTFVRHPSEWLRTQGGMAALLSPKAIHAKK